MTFLALIVLIFKLPLLALGFLLKHKFLLIIGIVAVAAVFAMGHFNRQPSAQSATNTNTPAYQTIAPDASKAPYVVQTTSRVFYVVSYTEAEVAVTLNEYYTYDSKKWQKQNDPLILDRATYGEIRIYGR